MSNEFIMTMYNSDNLVGIAIDIYSDMIIRIAVSHVQNVTDAEDIVQEVFLALLKSQKSFENEQHLKAWLIRVAINKCNDAHRSKRSTVPLDSIKQAYKFDEYDSGVMQQIQKLRPLDRNIVFLHYIEGYSAAEVGKITGKKTDAIYTRLKRIRRKLKDLLNDDD